MKDIIFATYVTSDNWKEKCAEPLRRSFLYFNPGYEFKIFEGTDVNNVVAEEPTQNIRFLKPSLGKKLRDEYRRVVLLDADQLVVASLPELIETEWEVAGVRSNDDNGISLPCGAFCTPRIPWQEYLNCGLCGVAKKEAWDEWDRRNRTEGSHMNDAEQGLWNETFHSGHYNKKLLDPVEGDLIYGTAANSHHWHLLYMDNGSVGLNLAGRPKWVKILHRAGVGHIGEPDNKFHESFFKPEVYQFIKEITK